MYAGVYGAGGDYVELVSAAGVSSVNGLGGPAVSLTSDDIPEGSTNLYYTDARVAASASISQATVDIYYHGLAITQAQTQLTNVSILATNNNASLAINTPATSANTTGRIANTTAIANISVPRRSLVRSQCRTARLSMGR